MMRRVYQVWYGTKQGQLGYVQFMLKETSTEVQYDTQYNTCLPTHTCLQYYYADSYIITSDYNTVVVFRQYRFEYQTHIPYHAHTLTFIK